MHTKLMKVTRAAAEFHKKWGFFPMGGGAVVNDYVDSTVASGKKGHSLDVAADVLYVGIATFEIAAADDDASIYRLFKNVDSNLIPVSMRVSCDAITGATDVDFGLYDPLEAGGAVVDKDCFGDGLNISAGYSRILGLDCLVSVDLANVRKRIWEHVSGLTLNTKKQGYDICMTANTVGSGAGTVSVVAYFAQG